eukprot:5847217-Prymnesium_polylepis.1
MERVGADGAEEVAVVRDNDDRVLPLLEVALEPDHRVQVEVVGRLVEQQQPRLAEEGAVHGGGPHTKRVAPRGRRRRRRDVCDERV